MKCFSIKNKKVVKGISTEVPHTPKVKCVGGRIPAAQFVLEALNVNDAEFLEMQEDDLSSASSLARFELTPHTQRKKHKHILVSFDPMEYRLAKEYGDKSDIVYRTSGMFIVRSPLRACHICLKDPEHRNLVYVINKKGVLICQELSDTELTKRERKRIDQRRLTFTTVYEY